MTEKNINARVIHKHDIEANWKKATNFIPKKAEIIVYDKDENYDYPRFKIGDGETNVDSLPFTVEKIVEEILNIANISYKPRPYTITIYGESDDNTNDIWETVSDNVYRQNVTDQFNDNITEYSKIDMQPTPEQLSIFHSKDVAFTIVNEDGIAYLYAIGTKPLNDYENVQVTIMEVLTDA